MNEYAAILVYAGFALIVFSAAMIWQHYRDFLKKKFRMINYHSDGEDPKIHHV